jgi:gas vesicle protein
MEKSSDGSGFFSGFIIGAIAGFFVAVLLTPKTGEETRIMIKRNAEEKMPEVREKAEWIKEKAVERAPEIRERAEELAAFARDRGIAAFDEIRTAGKPQVGKDLDEDFQGPQKG